MTPLQRAEEFLVKLKKYGGFFIDENEPAAQIMRELMEEIKNQRIEFKAKIIASDGPAFGCYLSGSAKDGEAIIFLNIAACLAMDKDPKRTSAEILAHEVLHACQEILGEELSESDIERGLAKIEGVELETCEDTAQYCESLLNEIQEKGQTIQQLTQQIEELKKHEKTNLHNTMMINKILSQEEE